MGYVTRAAIIDIEKLSDSSLCAGHRLRRQRQPREPMNPRSIALPGRLIVCKMVIEPLAIVSGLKPLVPVTLRYVVAFAFSGSFWRQR